ncbi:hypothetical protein [Providencia phage PSTCR5]|uniref:RNA ligase domain-containing protein n=1 Tax=Providencia phage PSTCR5 TaxID=2783547 RepID=A0A873WX38_9CAUD|nr:hypothetical protein KNV68_gp141 [Providencia phage PSTCR5]QPB12217.1 hypothetical protein [Providencia phage PSTCR5]
MNNVKFPSIQQFRNAVSQLRRLDSVSSVEYVGYTKLHGTNASVIVDENFNLYPQSKTRFLTVDEDNAGFAQYVQDYANKFEAMAQEILENHPEAKLPIIMCGEFAGGNIQRGVALNGLPKFFSVFGYGNITNNDSIEWLPFDHDIGQYSPVIYNISQFGAYYVTIDPTNPAEVQNELVDLTVRVEAECPAGAYFGISGTGEGVVWRPLDDELVKNKDLWFKVKGDKHSSSKVRTLASVDPEVAKSITEFVEYVTTESRLDQGITEVGGADLANTGAFLKWLNKDIIKEESDTLAASGLEFKDVAKAISRVAVAYFKGKV